MRGRGFPIRTTAFVAVAALLAGACSDSDDAPVAADTTVTDDAGDDTDADTDEEAAADAEPVTAGSEPDPDDVTVPTLAPGEGPDWPYDFPDQHAVASIPERRDMFLEWWNVTGPYLISIYEPLDEVMITYRETGEIPAGVDVRPTCIDSSFLTAEMWEISPPAPNRYSNELWQRSFQTLSQAFVTCLEADTPEEAITEMSPFYDQAQEETGSVVSAMAALGDVPFADLPDVGRIAVSIE